MRRGILLTLLTLACWQPPDLPPPPPQPSNAELLASRPYKLHSPVEVLDGGALPAAPSDAGWPLLVVLHGYRSTGSDSQEYLHLDTDEVRSRYFIITPLGRAVKLPNQDTSFAWYPDATSRTLPPWDSAWLRAVLLDALAQAPIDPARVSVVGVSQGGHMAHRLACDSADIVSTVVALAGQLDNCEPAKPVSVLQVHGDADRTISYITGKEALALWAQVDGCTGPIIATGEQVEHVTPSDGGDTTVWDYQGCPAGTTVRLWKMHGIGHSPPLADAFATDLLKFIDAHPRR
jgi:polyhydroxybutyrate depolymerase